MLLCKKCNFFTTSATQALNRHVLHCSGEPRWVCTLCSIPFRTKYEMRSHNKEKGHKPGHFISSQSNRKQTFACRWCRKERSTTKTGIGLHQRYCKENPDAAKPRVPSHTDESKLLLSEIMKKRHAENKAAKWKNPSLYESYPERFFQRVIDNEFTDRRVTRELPFGRYLFDFAWEHKMKVIEIDGDQHQRFRHQRESDARKDAKASQAGWVVLRIAWKDFYANPKYWIQISKDFIGE